MTPTNTSKAKAEYVLELLQKSPSFIAVLRGPTHVFELANEAYYQLLGQRDILGKAVLDCVPEALSQGYITLLDNVYSTQKPFIGKEVPLALQRQTQVETRYIDFIYQPMMDDDNNTTGIFVEGHDVTENFLAKKKLIENEERLEEQVRQRTLSLNELNELLQKSNENLLQFAHVASHDLKEPVRKIDVFSKRLKDEFNHLLPEDGKLYLNKILRSTDRMYAMIEGILAHSTLSNVEYATTIVDLNKVFETIQTDLEVVISEKNATFIIEKLPLIKGSPVLLYQLFYNLLNNALKFSRSDVHPLIKITYSKIADHGKELSRVTVIDNGIGFNQDSADTIFKMFSRLNSKDDYEGTGLGLALCKKITERHGGSITAISQKNAGSEFIVQLPLTGL